MDDVKVLPKKNKLRLFILNLGKLAIDIAKLCFAGLVLGTVMKGEVPHSKLLFVGIIVSAVCSLLGLISVSFLEEK